MSVLQPFNPTYGSNQVLTAGASSLNAAIASGNKQVIVTNSGTNIGYVKITTDPAATASTADMPILPKTLITLTKPMDSAYIAYISATGTTIQVITGEGW